MADYAITNKEKRFYFNWLPDILFRPRLAFHNISTSTKSIWITPLLVLSFLVLVNALVAGYNKYQASQMGEISYPPDYQYYTPEQQAQYIQAIQSTQGPVFVYVLPAISSLLGVWIGWLILGGILHLVTTLLGGRGSTAMSMNIVAWASIPIALRALIQIIYMLVSKNLIASPGLSGFSPSGDSVLIMYISQVLKLIDIFILWQILLLILGVRISTSLSASKSSVGVILTVSRNTCTASRSGLRRHLIG